MKRGVEQARFGGGPPLRPSTVSGRFFSANCVFISAFIPLPLKIGVPKVCSTGVFILVCRRGDHFLLNDIFKNGEFLNQFNE